MTQDSLLEFKYEDIKFDHKSIAKTKNELIIAGYANVFLKDLQGEFITKEALQTGINQLFERESSRGNKPTIQFMHQSLRVGEIIKDYTTDKGEVLTTHVDDTGLFIVVKIYRDSKASEEVVKLIEEGKLRGFSIGGRSEPSTKTTECNGQTCQLTVHDIELHEISLVGDNVNIPGPANQGSSFFVVKADLSGFYDDPQIVTFKTTEKADVRKQWNADEARVRILKWATNSSGLVDIHKYAQGFVYIDGDAMLPTSYKLPHHDIIDGELKVVLAGVQEARRALVASKLDLPKGMRHLSRHIRQYGKSESSIFIKGDWIEERDDENHVHIYKNSDNILGDLSKSYKFPDEILKNSQLLNIQATGINTSDNKMTEQNTTQTNATSITTPETTVDPKATATQPQVTVTVNATSAPSTEESPDSKAVAEEFKKYMENKDNTSKLAPEVGELLTRVKAVIEQYLASANGIATASSKAAKPKDEEEDPKKKKPFVKSAEEPKPETEGEVKPVDTQAIIDSVTKSVTESITKALDEKVLNITKSLTVIQTPNETATPGPKSAEVAIGNTEKPKSLNQLTFDEQVVALKGIKVN